MGWVISPSARIRAAPSKPCGFTIIELLVTISVITILIATMMPAMAKSRDYAERSLCQNNLRQIVIAWGAFPSDNDNKIVNGMPDDTDGWVKRGAGYDPIMDGELFNYIRTIDVYDCPSDTVGNERSFSIAAPMHGEAWDRHITSPNHSWVQAGTDIYTEIIFPEKQMALIEELDTRGWNIGSWIMYARESRKYRWIDFMANFHGDGTNLSFADGHVSFWYWEDPDTLYASANGQFYLTDYGNVDWLRVRNHYRQLPDYPDVPQDVTP